MANIPNIGTVMDEEEQAVIDAIENDDYKVGLSALSSERLEVLRTTARNTMNEERTRISLRVPRSDLSHLKAQAMREGVPYQTLINSILHKAVMK